MTTTTTSHGFIAAEPNPKPRGWTYWRDDVRRAKCLCGWVADTDSSGRNDALALWRTHRQEATS